MTKVIETAGIEALLLDLGGVVIDIDFERAIARWAELASCSPQDVRPCFERDDAYNRHERGEISGSEYFAYLGSRLPGNLDEARIAEGWDAIFVGVVPGVMAPLERLRRRLATYAFTNSNPVHQVYCRRHFPDALGLFRDVFVSSTIGLRKPDPIAYGHVVEAIGVAPGAVLFFDNSLENLAGAATAGLRTVHVPKPSDAASIFEGLALSV